MSNIDLGEFIQDVEELGIDAAKAKIKAAQQREPEPPDFDEQEREELSRVRQGDWRQISRVQEKYFRLRNPVTPTVRRDPEIEQAKASNSLQQLYNQRVGKIRHGDVNALVALKKEFRENGLEVY
jgi:hypothetical protein